MSPRLRVLIVDDSVVMRRVLTDVLASEPWIEVVGTAANGRIALNKLPQVSPDLVTLDVEMPELDGLETLTEIRKDRPKLPVIMFSTLTERGGAITLEALSRGATDYATKPQQTTGVSDAVAQVKAELLPRIRALFPHAEQAATSAPTRSLRPLPSPRPRPAVQAAVRLIAIGCSTGGPNALAELFGQLPAEIGVPIIVTQHMPPLFTRLLAERLTSHSSIAVTEASGDELLAPGAAVLARGDHHLLLARSERGVRTMLSQTAPENSCRPAVDPMLASAVSVYGAGVLAVVLTGMGQDGLRGCEQVRAAGGQVIVQDEASSVVWGMPGFVARAGLADAVLPLTKIADEILRRVRVSGSRVLDEGAA